MLGRGALVARRIDGCRGEDVVALRQPVDAVAGDRSTVEAATQARARLATGKLESRARRGRQRRRGDDDHGRRGRLRVDDPAVRGGCAGVARRVAGDDREAMRAIAQPFVDEWAGARSRRTVVEPAVQRDARLGVGEREGGGRRVAQLGRGFGQHRARRPLEVDRPRVGRPGAAVPDPEDVAAFGE